MSVLIFIILYLVGFHSLSFENAFNIDNFKEFYKRSFDFLGITKRGPFWITQAWLLVHSVLLGIVGICLFVEIRIDETSYISFDWTGVMKFFFIPIYAFSIVSIIPSISIQVRRLRDCGKNPLWILISLIPFIGGGLIINFLFIPLKRRHPTKKTRSIR